MLDARMLALTHYADVLLRDARGCATVQLPRRILLALLVLCGAAYGAVMGSYGGWGSFIGLRSERGLQILISATKVPLLLLATFALALPSFFVLNTLLGVRRDFGAVLRALVGAQAALTIVLVALAPYTAFWYASFTDYQSAILFNGVMFAVASLGGQWHLRRAYRPLIERSPRHRVLLRGWLVLYVFVGIQMAWVLRPFIGDPAAPAQFFRAGAWGNAYVVVARLIWGAITH